MLLRDVQVLLTHHHVNLRIEVRDLPGNLVEVQNRESLRTSLLAIRDVPSLENQVATILRSEIFSAPSAVLSPELSKHLVTLRQLLSGLSGAASALYSFLNSTIGAPPPFYVTVKLPGRQAVDASTKLLNSVHIALDQPVRRLGHEPLQIAIGEPGSVWLELVAGSAGVLTIIGTLLRLATDSMKLKQEQAKLEAERAKAEQEQAKATQEQAKAEQEASRVKGAGMDLAKKILEHRISIFELEKQAEISGLVNKHATANHHESESTLLVGIEALEELFSQKVEVRLQLDAPSEVRSAYPKAALVENRGIPPKEVPPTVMKRLPAKTTGSTESET